MVAAAKGRMGRKGPPQKAVRDEALQAPLSPVQGPGDAESKMLGEPKKGGVGGVGGACCAFEEGSACQAKG